jgi:hypothetical protein
MENSTRGYSKSGSNSRRGRRVWLAAAVVRALLWLTLAMVAGSFFWAVAAVELIVVAYLSIAYRKRSSQEG